MSISKSKQKLSDRYSSTNTTGSAENEMNVKKTSGFFSKPLVIAGIVVAGIAVGTVAVAVLPGSGEKKGADNASEYNLVVTPENSDELSNENVSKAAAGTYDVCMNSTWTFRNAKSPSNTAYVENIASNTNTVNFVVKRDDTEDVIYESPYIPVGNCLKNIKLTDESLKKGTYPCTLTYHLVDKDYKEISHLNISISIVIEND